MLLIPGGTGNGERGTGNGERGTGNREQESGNECTAVIRIRNFVLLLALSIIDVPDNDVVLYKRLHLR